MLKAMTIVLYVCQGMTNQDISKEMGVSIKTIEAHKSRLFKHFSVTNQSELILYIAENQVQKVG